MNKQRKHKVREIRKTIELCKNNLQLVLDEEENVFENMPENLQGSLRGSESEDAIDTMENVIEKLESVLDELIELI